MKSICTFSLATFALLISLSSSAQTLDELAPPPGTPDPLHVYVDYGWALILPGGETDTLQNEGASNHFWYGLQLHRRFNKHLGGGLQFSYVRSAYRLTQDTINPLGFSTVHDQQKYIANGLGVALYGRYQISDKGDYQGRYVDVGGYLNVHLGERLHTENEVDPALNAGATLIESDYKKLDYTENIAYGVYGKVGFGLFYLYGRYRLSDLFKANDGINNGYKISEFERLAIGIGFSVSPSNQPQ